MRAATGEAESLWFFKNGQAARWDLEREALAPGYPRSAADEWPGLLDVFPRSRLRGALHIPEWGRLAYFFFESQSDAVAWNLDEHAVEHTIAVADLLPGPMTEGDFTPVCAPRSDGRTVVYAFAGHDYMCWSVDGGGPATPMAGFPRRIADDWKEGLVLAPRSAVYVDWPNRSIAHSNRKIYFFMGDLYLRWDVPSHTRNYRLDIVSGWKGWPAFA